MNRLVGVLFFILFAATMMAVPAKPVKKTITLAGGQQVEVRLSGDEFGHYLLAADGTKYQEQTDGSFRVISDVILQQCQQKRVAVNTTRSARKVQRKATWGAQSNPISGSKRGLVILVNFSDKKMIHTQSEFDNQFNLEGYNKNDMNGSVHDYFYSCSYGKFDLQFDVVGPYTVSQTMKYYGQNDSDGNDLHAGEMVREAVLLADADGVDFSKYDWDDDSYVDQVFVIYAGYGEAQGASTNTIWPHEYELSSAAYYGDGKGAVTTDGVTIDTYACSCELCNSSGTRIDGIGTACHEFSHCMAIPDFYDTNGSNFGMDCWDVMDYGCYNGANGNGESPWLYTSYERMYCGWLTPTELKDPCFVHDISPLEDSPEAYIIYNEKNKNEYYMLENRQLKGFDEYGYGHGMLVLHVDFDSNSWINNTPNNTASHQRMTIIPADNSCISYGSGSSCVAGDPFPGTKNNTSLTNTSSPKASLYNQNTDGSKLMNKPITDIAENTSDGSISFTFNGGIAVPANVSSTDVLSDGFTATWDAVKDAAYYEVELTQNDSNSTKEDMVLLQEDFTGFANGNADGKIDISSSLDSYTKMRGWTGTKIFTSQDEMAKVGTSSVNGSLTTPQLTSTTGQITVEFDAKKCGTDNTTVNTLLDDGTIFSSNSLQSSVKTFYLDPIAVPTTFHLTLTGNGTKNRFYLSRLVIYDGAYDSANGAPRKAVVKTETYTTESNSILFTSLDAAYKYEFRVRSANENGQKGEWSDVVKVSLNPTSVNEISTSPINSTTIYDLSGRKLVNPLMKGIYIRSGKKYVK